MSADYSRRPGLQHGTQRIQGPLGMAVGTVRPCRCLLSKGVRDDDMPAQERGKRTQNTAGSRDADDQQVAAARVVTRLQKLPRVPAQAPAQAIRPLVPPVGSANGQQPRAGSGDGVPDTLNLTALAQCVTSMPERIVGAIRDASRAHQRCTRCYDDRRDCTSGLDNSSVPTQGRLTS